MDHSELVTSGCVRYKIIHLFIIKQAFGLVGSLQLLKKSEPRGSKSRDKISIQVLFPPAQKRKKVQQENYFVLICLLIWITIMDIITLYSNWFGAVYFLVFISQFLMWFVSQESMAYDLVIASTKIVNGQTLLETFMEKLG